MRSSSRLSVKVILRKVPRELVEACSKEFGFSVGKAVVDLEVRIRSRAVGRKICL